MRKRPMRALFWSIVEHLAAVKKFHFTAPLSQVWSRFPLLLKS